MDCADNLLHSYGEYVSGVHRAGGFIGGGSRGKWEYVSAARGGNRTAGDAAALLVHSGGRGDCGYCLLGQGRKTLTALNDYLSPQPLLEGKGILYKHRLFIHHRVIA